MGKYLDSAKPPNLNREETNKLNRPITKKEIKTLKKKSNVKILGSGGFKTILPYVQRTANNP